MPFITKTETFLASFNRRLSLHAQRFRLLYGSIAFILFCAGLLVSIVRLSLEWNNLELEWLLINLLIGAPLAIGLNSLGLLLSAKLVGASLGLLTAFRTCSVALCSNLLPIPAGTLIKASSLISHGGSALNSGLIVIVGNAISLSLVLCLVGVILATTHLASGLSLLVIGMLGLTTGGVFVFKRTSIGLSLAFLAIRLLRITVMVLRIQLSFLAIGLFVTLIDAALFSGAVAAGTMFAIFPAGLGVSEALASVLALATAVSPAAAFLATALNRIVTLMFAGAYLLVTKPAPLEIDTKE